MIPKWFCRRSPAPALGRRVALQRPVLLATVDQTRHDPCQPAMPVTVMAEPLFAGPQRRGEHLRQHLELVHLRQAVLDHNPVAGQVRVEDLLLVRQRVPPPRLVIDPFVRQMIRMRRAVLVRGLRVEPLEAIAALVQHHALRPRQAVQQVTLAQQRQVMDTARNALAHRLETAVRGHGHLRLEASLGSRCTPSSCPSRRASDGCCHSRHCRRAAGCAAPWHQ